MSLLATTTTTHSMRGSLGDARGGTAAAARFGTHFGTQVALGEPPW